MSEVDVPATRLASHRRLGGLPPSTTAYRVDSGIPRLVAAEYLNGTSSSAVVEAAWQRLAIETDRLYRMLTLEDWPGSVEVVFTSAAAPYSGASELIESVRMHGLLEITAAATDGNRVHPLFENSVGGEFDRFRAVHDILGHAFLGAGFDRDAEFSAWRFQERFHSPLARRALATELHAKHSVRWTSGEAPDHRAVLIDPELLHRSRLAARRTRAPRG